jgi:ATP-dependent DNA ligase
VLFNSPLDLDAFEKTAIGDGFEGVMLRPAGGKYKLNVRSSELLKVKRYKDAEFTVIDALMRHHHGIGKDIVDVFVLQNDQSEASFKAVPVGTIESRAEMWLKRDDYIGQQATVRFFERSIDLVPIGNPTFRGLRSALDATNGESDEDDDGMWTNKSE